MTLLRKSRLPSGRRQRQPGAGSQNQSAFSYRAQRSEQELNTGRQISREQVKKASVSFARFWLERVGLAILLVAVVASVVNVLSLSTDAKLVPLTTGSSSSFLHSQSNYQAAASKLLAGSIWNRNKVTVDTGQISRQLRSQFPELSSVSITLPLLAHRPLIYIQATQPALVLTTTDGSFVLDTTGKALLTTTNLSAAGQSSLPIVTDASGLHVTLDHQILTPDNVSFIQTVVAQLATKHITISAMTLPAAASELDVHLVGQPYFVKFNLQSDDARQQVGTFLATQAQLQSQHVTPAQYIDVRVDGRAYYQ
ncbi:MAG TPA: hypothetical protein VK712_00740 [Verrucomicrobiae bacterium]|jgi:hypothetical protein|nr:hypothetical protein [Verrucomicrobiae bacterium]